MRLSGTLRPTWSVLSLLMPHWMLCAVLEVMSNRTILGIRAELPLPCRELSVASHLLLKTKTPESLHSGQESAPWHVPVDLVEPLINCSTRESRKKQLGCVICTNSLLNNTLCTQQFWILEGDNTALERHTRHLSRSNKISLLWEKKKKWEVIIFAPNFQCP